MTKNSRFLVQSLYPLLDFILAGIFAYYAPYITNWVAPLFGWQQSAFFNLFTASPFLAGAALTIWVIAEKLIQQAQGLVYRPVTDQPLFYLALVAVLLGFQLFLAGFICEMISRNSSERNNYKIREEI